MRRTLARITAVLAMSGGFAAQGPSVGSTQGTSFEAVSIKRSTAADDNMRVRTPPGQFVMANGPAAMLVQVSYPDINSRLIDGLPDWAANERYDVTARAAGTSPPEALSLMMRTLLAERFNFAARLEMRERPVYALVKARADGRLGPSLRQLDIDCAARALAASKGQPPEAMQVPEGVPVCTLRNANGLVQGGGVSMVRFAQLLTGRADRVIVDRTGLTGDYAFTLNYAPDATNTADDRPSMPTALQEQLGLKLEPQRLPVEVLVIERFERPTEN